METHQIARVRRFHRMVTMRAGALEERFLGRDRPLGESRLLFEIGRAGATVLDLRALLGLDSGYLSRLLRRLEDEGLVERESAEADQRVREARLTRAGAAELEEIDERSDEAASAILEALEPADRRRLVEAMDSVHRLLGHTMLRFEATDPLTPAARWCLERYYGELATLFEEGFDPARSTETALEDFRPPRGAFLVGSIEERPVACGALTLLSGDVAYLKRMWVDGAFRGLGLGRRTLEALEARASAMGCGRVCLETNRALTAAIRLYRSSGYREVGPFNDEHYADHWFEKRLDEGSDA